MSQRMTAMVLDRFGGPERLALGSLPLPEVGPGELLLRVEAAGVGEWDPFEREGGYARMLGMEPRFPYVLGSEGAGVVVAVGKNARRFEPGDPVYAISFLNPKGGFYAEYVAVAEDQVAPRPATLDVCQAAALGGVGITALRGLEDRLQLRSGESLMIFGASGGVGHIAVQLAKHLGARVFAVASGSDGVQLAQRLGADLAVDGHRDDVLAAARAFAPQGLDAALLTAGGEVADSALLGLREGGRVAFPKGVQPEPQVPPGIRLDGYYGEAEPTIIARLSRLVEAGRITAEVARRFPLNQAREAHLSLGDHYLGKLVLQVRP